MTRHQRKLKKYSEGFNEKFEFFLKSYREGILSFCGSSVEVKFINDGPDCKEAFRMYDDGQFKNEIPYSRHPQILKALIIGKKSWGLWVKEWTDGISEWSFTKEEIFSIFSQKNIKIPESFLKDFENVLSKKVQKRNEKFFDQDL